MDRIKGFPVVLPGRNSVQWVSARLQLIHTILSHDVQHMHYSTLPAYAVPIPTEFSPMQDLYTLIRYFGARLTMNPPCKNAQRTLLPV